jgi:hypothetical protein
MTNINLPQPAHPTGGLPDAVETADDGPVVVDTYAGPVRVELRAAFDSRECGTATAEQLALLEKHRW